jgi:hypothetical protein
LPGEPLLRSDPPYAAISSAVPFSGRRGIKKAAHLLEVSRCIILILFYKLVPPPCSTGIIMTIKPKAFGSILVMTLFNLLLNIKECDYTNIPILKIKTKELVNYLLFK